MKRGRRPKVEPFDGAIRRMTASHKTVGEIAAFVGVSPSAISKYLKQQGITRSDPRPGDALSAESVRECAEAGLTRKEAADYLGKSYSHIASIAIRNGISFVRKPSNMSDRDAVLCQMFEAGNYSLQQVGDKFGLTRERVRQILAKHGIDERYKNTLALTLPLNEARELYLIGEDIRIIARRCGAAWSTVRKYLDADSGLERRRRIVRFWQSVKVTADPNRCWEWSTERDKNTRPSTSWEGKHKYSYHIAFMLANGYWSKKWVLHKCDNHVCCNPNHLYEGSPQDNVRDRDERGRGAHQTGKLGRRLTFEDRELIKDLLERGMKQGKIAEIVGFNIATVNKVSTGKATGFPIDRIPTEQLRHIFTDLRTGKVTQAYISNRYGLHPTTVRRIQRGTHQRVKKFL